jgi:hypothetical protein
MNMSDRLEALKLIAFMKCEYDLIGDGPPYGSIEIRPPDGYLFDGSFSVIMATDWSDAKNKLHDVYLIGFKK